MGLTRDTMRLYSPVIDPEYPRTTITLPHPLPHNLKSRIRTKTLRTPIEVNFNDERIIIIQEIEMHITVTHKDTDYVTKQWILLINNSNNLPIPRVIIGQDLNGFRHSRPGYEAHIKDHIWDLKRDTPSYMRQDGLIAYNLENLQEQGKQYKLWLRNQSSPTYTRHNASKYSCSNRVTFITRSLLEKMTGAIKETRTRKCKMGKYNLQNYAEIEILLKTASQQYIKRIYKVAIVISIDGVQSLANYRHQFLMGVDFHGKRKENSPLHKIRYV